MSFYSNKDFFSLLDEGLLLNDLSCLKLAEQLADLGSDITSRSLQRWRSSTAVPGFDNAKTVLTFLYSKVRSEVPNDDEIRESLVSARLRRTTEKSATSALSQTVRIPYRRLVRQEMQDGQIQLQLKQRIAETVGTEPGALNRYLTELIRIDMDKKILKRRNEE